MDVLTDANMKQHKFTARQPVAVPNFSWLQLPFMTNIKNIADKKDEIS